MEPKILDPAGIYKLEYTSSGSPYIAIPSRSDIPIYLTKYYPSDAPAVEAVLTLPAVNLHLISAPWPYTRADAEWWINNQLAKSSNLPLQVLRSGSPDADGRLIGSVSLMPPDSEVLAILRERGVLPSSLKNGKQFELGYYLHPDLRGKGIVKSGVKGLLEWAKAEHDVRLVRVLAEEQNADSRRVIESLGFFVRSESEDHVVEFPETKGGGQRKILVWTWTTS